jgi:hypothetical protein
VGGFVLLARGDDEPQREDRAPSTTTTAPAETASAPEAAPPPKPQRRHGRLAIGLTERNATLLWSRTARPTYDLGPWRDRVEALRPQVYRLMIDWAQLQPSPKRGADLAKTEDGCARGLGPCGAFDGIRDQLRAVKTQQDAHGGWEVLVTPYGVPQWAAAPPRGCERPGTEPRSRPFNAAGLRGYRRLVRDLLALARAEGVELKWWAPWNEPNQPFFISPQRLACSTSARSLAPGVYARITRALRAELPPRARLVLGDLAGVDGPSPNATGVAEFVAALPRDVACAGDAWAQHQYAEAADREGPVGQLKRALDRRRCTRSTPIWVTETGVGGAHAGDDRDTSPAALRRGCRLLNATLRRWQRDPRVDVAVQYTFREDTAFPVGLVDAPLTRAYRTYDLWAAWGGDRPADAAPPPRRTCSG